MKEREIGDRVSFKINGQQHYGTLIGEGSFSLALRTSKGVVLLTGEDDYSKEVLSSLQNGGKHTPKVEKIGSVTWYDLVLDWSKPGYVYKKSPKHGTAYLMPEYGDVKDSETAYKSWEAIRKAGIAASDGFSITEQSWIDFVTGELAGKVSEAEISSLKAQWFAMREAKKHFRFDFHENNASADADGNLIIRDAWVL